MGDGLPALGIVAAVLGVVKAMGALDQSPEILGGLIGVGAGRHLRSASSSPMRWSGRSPPRSRSCARRSNRLYIIVKQTLLAYMNGALPQVAVEYGRKTIPGYERPTIDEVERETVGGGREPAAAKAAA